MAQWKSILLGVLVCLVSSLTACGGGGGNDASSPVDTTEPTTPPPELPQVIEYIGVKSHSNVNPDNANAFLAAQNQAFKLLAGFTSDYLPLLVASRGIGIPTLNDSCVTGSLILKPSSENGRSTYVFDTCVIGGYTLDGAVSMADNTSLTHSMTLIEFYNLHISNNNTDQTVAGKAQMDLAADYSIQSGNINLTIRDKRRGIDIQLDDADIVAINNGRLGAQNGKLFLSSLGFLTLAAENDVFTMKGSNNIKVGLRHGLNGSSPSQPYFQLAIENSPGSGFTFGNLYKDEITFNTVESDDWINTVEIAFADKNDSENLVLNAQVNSAAPSLYAYKWTILDQPEGSDIKIENEGNIFKFLPVLPGYYKISVSVTKGGVVTSEYIDFRTDISQHDFVVEHPKSVVYGELFQATIRPVDDKSGPYQYELISGPEGMTVDKDGGIRWVATGSINFGSTSTYFVHISAKSSSQSSEQVFSFDVIDNKNPQPKVVPYSGVYLNTLYQLDHDDYLEGIARAGNGIDIFEVRADGIRWQLLNPFALIPDITVLDFAVQDVNGDGIGEILISSFNEIIAYNLDAQKIILQHNFDTSGCHQIDWSGDLSSDQSRKGILVRQRKSCSGDEMWKISRFIMLDANTLDVIWRSDYNSFGVDVDVLNVDSDPEKEIITSEGFVLSTWDGGEKLHYEEGFNRGFHDYGLIDSDGDDKYEVATTDGSRLYLLGLDGELSERYISFPYSFPLSAPSAVDWNRDGIQDILMALETKPRFYDISGGSSVLLEELQFDFYPRPLWYTVSSTKDLDGDSYDDFIFSSGNIIYFSSLNEARALKFDYPIFDDSDRNAKVQFVSMKPGQAPSLAFLDKTNYSNFDIYSYQFNESQFTKISSQTTSHAYPDRVAYSDIDSDGYPEVLFGGHYSDGSKLGILDTATQELIFSERIDNFSTNGKYGFIIADITGDGKKDILAKTSPLKLINGSTLTLVSESSLKESDLWLDGTAEAFFVSTKNGKRLIIQSRKHVSTWRWNDSELEMLNQISLRDYSDSDIYLIGAIDLDLDGFEEIIARNDNTTYIFNSSFDQMKKVNPIPNNGIFMSQSNGQALYLALNPYCDKCAGKVIAYDVATGNEVWRSPELAIDNYTSSLDSYAVGEKGQGQLVIRSTAKVMVTQ
ncbi:hypothetical protein O5O45_08990 [Hahella aquimaris]|uniref:hypothetical protein n=1 Tax=Hahella sp. HNIBRBA332 TaxID=3015983 RepID=UPI00273C4892|nr:hypothetical protein [Hahella sp. HNIBRBA332]WLQ16048.1 hypothetical protein O5O45_08990 [Hahella sp. HNIBRBA332]